MRWVCNGWLAGLANLHSAEARSVALLMDYLILRARVGNEPNIHIGVTGLQSRATMSGCAYDAAQEKFHLLVSPRRAGSSSGAPLLARTMVLKLRVPKIAA